MSADDTVDAKTETRVPMRDGKRLFTVQLFGLINEFDAETGEHLRQLEDFSYGIAIWCWWMSP